jgi:FAD/FMN-containing dehydrogenase
MPYPVFQTLFDALFVPGNQWYWKADFVRDLPDEAVDLNIQYAAQIPNFLSGTHLYPINGAAHRVGQADTAFSYREATYCQVMVGVTPDPAENERVSGWAKEYWNEMHPFSARGAYVNMMMEEGQDRIKAAYRENYDRLTHVKTAYDPHNLFRINQNIRPGPANKAVPAPKQDASAGVTMA